MAEIVSLTVADGLTLRDGGTVAMGGSTSLIPFAVAHAAGDARAC